MGPSSPIFELLAMSGEWEPLRSLAQDTGRSYETARRSVVRWKHDGLVGDSSGRIGQQWQMEGNRQQSKKCESRSHP